MAECKHPSIAAFLIAETGESAGLWACRECKRKFYPWESVETMIEEKTESLRAEGNRKDERIRLLVAAAGAVCEDADYDEENDVCTVSIPPLEHLQDVIDHDGIFPVSGRE